MRRWLALLLLALLPLQFSWAAVAAYCGHESGDTAQHIGHHPHEHAATHAEPAGAGLDRSLPDPGKLAPLDVDCGHCHGSCASMPAPVDGMAPLALATPPATGLEGAVRTLPQRPPERPQWPALA